MGNRKCSLNTISVIGPQSKRSQQSINTHKNASESHEQSNEYVLLERDVAFLSAQTGKYKYLFTTNLIKLCISCEPYQFNIQNNEV